MTSVERFDAIIIGSGQGGNPLASALAGAGWRTALVERQFIGGTCINVGCTPTKTMVASGRVAYLARRGDDYGVHSGDVRIDMRRIRQRKREIVESFRSGSQARLEKTENLSVIFGDASFVDNQSVSVRLRDGGERRLSAGKIFINAGCRPAVPEIDGLKNVAFLDSTSIMELEDVPEHLVVLGGGYVGLEFGQLFRRLGSKVTIVQRGGRLLAVEDADVAEEVANILKQDGIEVLLNAKAVGVAKSGAKVKVAIRSGEQSQEVAREVEGSHLLVATGRVPNSEGLKLSAAGIAADAHGFIQVNEKLETNVPGIFALGDIKGGPAFTHISYDDFRILRTNLLEKGNATTKGRYVPYAVFIDPQLGRVGLTVNEAREQKKKFRVAKMPMKSVARALETDETRGFMKAIVDSETEQILGAAVLGIEGGEIMTMLQLAMMGGLKFTALREATFAHPLLAESLNNLFGHFES
jgi:pyruvate/2-oxoglutarate dehydrogenase complex dihydrolipoamide dehydrogenase (E3) component